MKKLLSLVLLVGVAACQDQGPTDPGIMPQFAKPGDVIDNSNGAPSGKHFNLNIIGTNEKNPNMHGGNGHRIFVNLWSRGNPDKIMLCESGTEGCAPEGEFAVLDANGTDGRAEFSLPNPDPDCDGTTDYSVYVRALGKPGHHALMQTCYEDALGNTWCAVDRDGYVEQLTLGRTNGGKAKFENVSKDLLYVDYCVAAVEDEFGVVTCTDWAVSPLFGDEGADYWWEYDNYGQRVVQMRFYPDLSTEAWDEGDMYCPEA